MLATGLLLAPALLRAESSVGQSERRKAVAKKQVPAARKLSAGRSAPAAKRLSSTSKAKQGKNRPLSHRQLRARLHLEPDRIQEIQQALIQAGYLHGEANGRWEEPTREAMRRFQADHGFAATGRPEAKSLMKLGLGPHPLPPELDARVTAQAEAAPSAKADPTNDPSAHPTEAGSPPNK